METTKKIPLEEIAKAYHDYDENASEVARKLNLKYRDVLDSLESMKVKLKRGRKSIKNIESVIDAYEHFNGNASEASRRTGHSSATIRKYWKQEGLKLKRGRNLSQKDKEIVKDAYELSNGNVSEASRRTGYSSATIRKYWKQEGLKLKIRRNLSQKDKEIIRDAYEFSNGNASEASRRTGYTNYTILRYWKKEGLKLKRGRSRINLSQKDKEIIRDAYELSNGNASEASRRTGYTSYIILKYWKQAGFETRENGGELLEKEKREIISLYKKFNGNISRITRELKHKRDTILKYIKKFGIERNN